MNKKIFLVLFGIVSFSFVGLKSQELKEFNEEASTLLLGLAGSDVKCIKELLNKGANINYGASDTFYGFTPLCRAIYFSKLDNIKFLLFNGADIDIATSWTQHKSLLQHIKYEILNYDNSRYMRLRAYNSKDALIVIHDLLIKHQSRLKNLKNKNLSDIVKKVNQILPKIRRDKIYRTVILPEVLEDLVLVYCGLYPEDFEDFFKLTEEEVNQIIKIYYDEFEKKEVDKKVEEVSSQNCSVM